MSKRPTPSLAPSPERWWPRWFSVGILVAACLVAYHNSFSGPFIFDDIAAISEGNPSIRRLGAIGDVLSPPNDAGQTVGGRPLANLTLAVNYAIGGTDPRGYHIFNLAVHISAAWVLLALLHRTLQRPVFAPPVRDFALPLATTIALLWAVHPLQTESVTYVVQRVESLAGLFLVLTLLCFARGADAKQPARWMILAVLACLCGMATKEIMVVAPILALLYDRTFLAGTFREAWQRRGRWHLALCSTWALLAWLVAGSGGRGGTAGVATLETWLSYLATQAWAVVRYVRLAFWPDALVFDYGPFFVSDGLTIGLCVGVVVLGLGLTVWALRRAPVAGFAGAWFFLILAPSSIVPVTVQTVAEHRVYLPLVAVVGMVVVGLHTRGGRRWFAVWPVAAIALIAATIQRNTDYASDRAIWADVVRHWPGNARGHASLATALAQRGEWAGAIAAYREALRIEAIASPHQTHTNLGVIHVNLANTLMNAGETDEALAHFGAALRLDPAAPEVRSNYGLALLQLGRPAEAAPQFAEALRLQPDRVRAHVGLADALVQTGRSREAVTHYESALRLQPNASDTLNNLAGVYFQEGRYAEAIARYQAALQLDPQSAQTLCNLGNAFAVTGRTAEAVASYEHALRLDPALAQARHNLSLLRAP